MKYEDALIEANRCLSCKNPRCQIGCPTGMRIKDFIQEIKNENLEEAASIIRSCSSLSTICSVVCPHEKQCVGHCILNAKQKPIQIGKLEKFVFDAYPYQEKIIEDCNKKIAIIGAGPSGIACALELAVHGCKVEIFEAEPFFGGVLSYGIPNFRLSTHRILELEARLKSVGVKIHYHKKLKELDIIALKEEYDDVFIGVGLTRVRELGIPNDTAKGVLDAFSFLKQANYFSRYDLGEMPQLKGKTIVVGAGNVAMDAARMAVRCGSEEVTIVYRRTLEEAPANKVEIEEAKLDCVKFKFLTNPVEVLVQQGRVSAVRCEKMILGEPDESGRKKPYGSGEYMDIPCDTIISAIGQIPDTLFTNTVFKTDHGYLVCDDFKTSIPGIYAGGDIVLGAKTVVMAQRTGRLVAEQILGKNGV